MSNKLISQLHHVELFSAKPDETVRFFKDILGMQESARDRTSVYLRAWGEWFHHSLKVTEGPGPGLAHAAWRTDGPDELDDAAKLIRESGLEGRWTDGDVGHGRAFEFWLPGGHLVELVWDAERYVAPPELKSSFPNRPQRQVTQGAPVRRIDHLTTASAKMMEDISTFRDVLGFRFMEGTLGPNDSLFFATLTSGPQNHDFAIVTERPGDPSVKPGRMNHVCYYYDTREDLLRALDVLSEYGYKLEAGPLKHGIGELFFAYVFEPGGTMVELQTGGYWNFMPDWETLYWPKGGIDGANTAWHVNQFGVFGMSPTPAGIERLPDSSAPTQQFTAKDREAQFVG
jgi:catechol 2,3-dioxygenase